MFSKIRAAGLSLALVMPQMPVPSDFERLVTMPQGAELQVRPSAQPAVMRPGPEERRRAVFQDALRGASKFSVSTVFSNTGNGINQHVTIAHKDETFSFSIVSLDCGGRLSGPKYKKGKDGREAVFSSSREDFMFSQGLAGPEHIRTKKWIVARKSNASTGSIYRWRFDADGPGNGILIEPLPNGHARVFKTTSTEKIEIARIEPFVYWTHQGVKRTAQTSLELDPQGGVILGMTIHEPAAAYPLLIDPTINYGRWLGDAGAQFGVVYTVAVETGSGEVYAGGSVNGPVNNIPATLVGTYVGGAAGDGFVMEIAPGSPPAVNWVHYIGGAGSEWLVSVAVNGDEVYAGGYTTSSDSWDTVAATIGTLTNTSYEGFVVEIADGSPPSLTWRAWVGGNGHDYIYGVAVNGDEVYAGGESGSETGWDTFASTVGTYLGSRESFVVELGDGATPTYNWRMWVGGSAIDYLRGLAVNGDEIYAGGYTYSSDSWETAGSTAGTYTNTGNSAEGFVVEIADGGPPVLNWVAWVGGTYAEYLYALAVNGDEIYAGGLTLDSASWDTFGSTLGSLTNVVDEGFVVEIADAGPPAFNWRVWLGGRSIDSVYSLAVNGDEIYAGGFSNSSGSWDTVGSRVGTVTNTGSNGEAFVVEIADGGPPSLAWHMWLGGKGADDEMQGLAVHGDAVYAGGGFGSDSGSIETFSFRSGVPGASGSGVIAELDDGGPPTYFWLQVIGQAGIGQVYVNGLAVNGNEIYAGGYTTAAAGLGTVNVGTFTAGAEGFVVEVADGGTPSVAWNMWLGGTDADRVEGVAVNGDEIYAAGWTLDPASWDTAASIVGTYAEAGQEEGFVVEIADGATPSVAWRHWIGSTDTDYILAMAINGDEIYAGGYSHADFGAGWETAGSTLGTYAATGNQTEGFVVEIADGGPPSLAWMVWLGGTNDDEVYALAVTGDEIYAAGRTYNSATWDTMGSVAGTGAASLDEGFVVEIADGGPPSFAWLMWLGGSSNDRVLAAAVNGDEIYAGGYTQSSATWDTAATTAGTLTNTGVIAEGFVVEIADGGPPILAWRMWVGGISADQVTSLAVDGDEIYAGGYSNSSASWDTAVSTIGTFGTTVGTPGEGFVVEITDGSAPELAWRIWQGGASFDQVKALAVSGDEIYTGGYSTSAGTWEAAFYGTKSDGIISGFVVEIGDDGTAAEELNSIFFGMSF